MKSQKEAPTQAGQRLSLCFSYYPPPLIKFYHPFPPPFTGGGQEGVIIGLFS
jgi:hypothetical protein